MKKTALITGITGQDGSYLAELLLEKGYEVHGIIRRHSSIATDRIDHLYENEELRNQTFFLHHGDLTDSSNLNRLIEQIQPDEIYNLAAQSHVAVSFEVPEYTAETTGCLLYTSGSPRDSEKADYIKERGIVWLSYIKRRILRSEKARETGSWT